MENLPTTVEERDLIVYRDPSQVLEEAHKAAKALHDVISKKKKPVMMNGEQYLEFEDWQTVGRFYGVTVKVVSSKFIEFSEVGPKGYEAKAEVIRPDGTIISGAEAMCLDNERNWSNKPLFMLRSMAQTRACAKALRNVLAWVVVLAGYKPTPAEEMGDLIDVEATKPAKEPPKPAPELVDPSIAFELFMKRLADCNSLPRLRSTWKNDFEAMKALGDLMFKELEGLKNKMKADFEAKEEEKNVG